MDKDGGFPLTNTPSLPYPLPYVDFLILEKLRTEFTGITVSQLTEFLKRKLFSEDKREKIQKKVHVIINTLEKEGLITTETIGNYRFAKITTQGVLFLSKIDKNVDLFTELVCPKPLFRTYRASKEWYEIAQRLLNKPVERFEPIDKELLDLSFKTWLENIEKKVLVFMDLVNGNVLTKPYLTRFNSENQVKYLLGNYNKAWEIATEQFNEGISLTITLPPIFPLKIEQFILSFAIHRIKSLLRKTYGFSPLSIIANEPQDNLNIHKHIILFNIERVMDKRELTKYLNRKVEDFLKDLGTHIFNTINNRLSEEEIKSYNQLGRKLFKRYNHYKEKHKKFEGPINWITKIKKNENGIWEYENPPNDYIEFKKKHEDVSVVDYLKKYLIKNLKFVLKKFGEDIKVAWYWLMRIRFYTLSPKLRHPKEKPPPSRYIFLGAYYEWDLIHAPFMQSKEEVF